MSAQTALLQGRRFAESIMRTTGTVSRATGEFTKDPVSREETPIMGPVYSGPCMLKMDSAQPSSAPIPGVIATEQSLTLFLPIGGTGADQVTTDDVWVCTGNPDDPTLVGKTMRIAGVHHQTFSTAYRFPVEETS